MSERPTPKFRPAVERLEEKRPLSGGAAAAHHLASPKAAAGAPASPEVSAAGKPTFGYLVYRITNPTPFNDKLVPPFSHVLVQTRLPTPGRVYNVLFVAVRNGTAQTFTAADGLGVRFPGQPAFLPILKGDQQWKPGQEFVFYVLTKKYYPVPSVVTSGFQFNLGGAKSTAIPGPSGIFLRLNYNPATIDKVLDWIVLHSPGVPGGPAGIRLGLPDTAIYEFVSAKTNRIDFGGYF